MNVIHAYNIHWCLQTLELTSNLVSRMADGLCLSGRRSSSKGNNIAKSDSKG